MEGNIAEDLAEQLLTVEEQPGRLLYETGVIQSNLSYFQRNAGRYILYFWHHVLEALEDFRNLGSRIFSTITVAGRLLKHEALDLLIDIRHIPRGMVYAWQHMDFRRPFRNFLQSYDFTRTIREEFFRELNRTIRNTQRDFNSPWSLRFKLYIGYISCLSAYTLYHYVIRPWPTHKIQNEVDCLHRTVVITGASSGIGYRLAYEFLRRGAFVILASPDMVKARKARLDMSRKLVKYIYKRKQLYMDSLLIRNFDQIELPYHLDIDYLLQNIIEVELNLSSTASIYSFARKVQGMSPDGVDILINNAAFNAPPEEMVVTDEGKEAHFAVNYYGHFVLTNLLLSLLAKRRGARVINVSCQKAIKNGYIKMDEFIAPYLQEDGVPFLPAKDAYANSKLALYLFSRQLAKELMTSGIYNVTTYCVCPGNTDTFLNRHVKHPSIFATLKYSFARKFYKGVLQASQPILHCAISKACGNESGFFYENNNKSTVQIQQLDSEKVAKDLWDSSIKLMSVGHMSMLKLTEQMHVLSHENIFQLAKDLFLHRRDVMTHLLLTEEKQAFKTRHKIYKDESNHDARENFTYFWNGFYLSGGAKSGLIERWVLYNTHPGFRALQQEYDVWFECTGSAHFHPESSGKMAGLQYMNSMAAPLSQDDIAKLEQVYESDSEPDEDIEYRSRYYQDYISVDELI